MQQYGIGDFGHSSTYRGQFSNVNNVCRNGSLVDSDHPAMTTFHRRSKQYNNHFSHKNQQNAVNNNIAVIVVRIIIIYPKEIERIPLTVAQICNMRCI